MRGLAVQPGHSAGEVRVCAPPDSAELPAGVGAVRPPVTPATLQSAADPRAAEFIAARIDTVAAAVEECDAPVAAGVMPSGGWR